MRFFSEDLKTVFGAELKLIKIDAYSEQLATYTGANAAN
jgi:hypothetical protein